MIRCMLFSSTDDEPRFGGAELLEDWSDSSDKWLWLDIASDSDPEVNDLLRSRFGVDKLAIADALRLRHPPKIENFGNQVFLLARGLDAGTTDIYYKTIQLAFFIGANYLVTFRRDKSLSLDRIWQSAEKGELSLVHGPIYITCKVLRAVVDRYTPILLDLERRIEEMEDEIFVSRDDKLLEELVDYNSNLKKMRRTLTYHCNILSEFKHLESVASNSNLRHRVHDVFEQFDRLNSLSSLYQELVVDLMNGYLSLSSHRLNQIMKVLTIFTVVFLPLTLMVGIYGMNFDNMPELRWRYGYFAVLTTMVVIVLSAFSILKWKKWW